MWRVSGIFALLAAPVAADAAQQEIILRERLSPTNAVRSAAGDCGANRYRIELRHNGRRNELHIEVNGRAVRRAELGKVISAVRPGYFMFEPAIAECFWDRPHARMRLITDGPSSGGKREDLSFEVSPAGEIIKVRPD